MADEEGVRAEYAGSANRKQEVGEILGPGCSCEEQRTTVMQFENAT